jgi:hypothetical protein
MVTLLNPGLLPWLFAVGVPLAIHLLTRRTRKRAPLPTVRFLQRAIAQQSRLFRLRHLVLLVLRTLAVAALALAFVKPTINSRLGTPGTERTAAILVLDSSASMAYSTAGISAFSSARNEALKVLAGLKPGDEANIIFCDSQPKTLLSDPADDFGALERGLRSAQPTEERAEPVAAINLAVEQLAKTKSKTKRLYLFSDFQRTNWANVKFEAVPNATQILFVAANSGRAQNVGITALHLFPTTPHVGEPISVECDLFNSSDGVRHTPVTLTLSNGGHATQNLDIAPYSTATATFSFQFDTAEEVECTASIPTDNLPIDDSRRIVIDLRRMATVVLITDEDTNRSPGGAFFVARALRPDPNGQAGFRVIPVKPTELNNPLLHAADAVIVCNAPQMPDVQYQALSRYVTGGGSLIWFLYGNGIGAQINALGRQLPTAEPLPLQVDHVVNLNGNGKGYVTLTEARYESQLLKAFKDPAAADLSHIHFTRICTTSEVDPRAETLLKYDDGTAAAVRTGEGSGNLLLVNMSPDPAWSDLARQQAFLPLLHEFLKGLLTRELGVHDFLAGGAASTTIPTDAGHPVTHVVCTGPEGDVSVTADPVTGSVILDHTKRCGFYHIAAGGKPAGDIAVNVSQDETDLRAIDPRELESDRRRQNSYLAGTGAADADVGDLGKGHPLWHYLLLAALLCLFAEQWVGQMTPRMRK